MKPELLKAITEHLKSDRGQCAQIANDLQDGLPDIDPLELARIVEMRLKKENHRSPATIAQEIDAALDLIEACRVMTLDRSRRKRSEGWKASRTAFDEEPTDKEKAIRDESYPLKFNTGLTRMGVPEKEQEWKFEQFFRGIYPQWRWVETGCHGLFEDFIKAYPVTPGEITAALGKLKIEGWSSASHLGNVHDHWAKWWQAHKHDAQKLGGQRSAKKRATEAAKKKGQLKPKARSVGKSGRRVERTNR
jgi:hypothetical protein